MALLVLLGMDTLWRIVGPDFVAGLIVAPDGGVIATAPILYGAFHGREIDYVVHECRRLGWRIDRLTGADLSALS